MPIRGRLPQRIGMNVQPDDLNPDDYLAAFVREATGNPDALPRDGQQAAYTSMTLALDHRAHFLASLPTGSGKSALALAAAAYRAVEHGERTVISTESLSLLTQIMQKDGPAMQRAVGALGVGDISIAAHKGVSNYLDPRKLFDTASILACMSTSYDIAELRDRIRTVTAVPAELDGEGINPRRLRNLVLWGLGEFIDDESTGDRHEYHGDHTAQEWALVSASSSAQAATEKDTPYVPKILLARMRAGEADIVVTNHTLLGIQAAQGLRVVNGSKTIGSFQNIIVDEAHALPAEVRARGAAEVSGRIIHSLIRAVMKLAEGQQAHKWSSDGEKLADRLEQIIFGRLKRGEQTARLGEGDNPLQDISEHLQDWVKRTGSLLKPAAKSTITKTMLEAFRAIERAEELGSAIDQVSEHRSGQARWIQADERTSGLRWTSVQASLVDVSMRIAANLWNTTGEDGESVPVGVVCMSATLPSNFQFELGAAAPVIEYPSPFTEAYARSMLFIPAVTQATVARDVPALTSDRYGPRKFDTAKHTVWASGQIVDLVRANGGSALVLAATAANGRAYVDALRKELPHLTVHSQWDGATAASLVSQWRDDHDSVLVGTRSYMTGVDAPGATCTLLVLDRIPRSPSNPLDDARVEAIMARLNCDKWAADRFVYAADAALLEQQAIGRLVRSVSDSGTVAVLDPRLVRSKAGVDAGIGYPETTRQVYAAPLRAFTNVIVDRDDALAWVKAHREQFAAVPA